MNRTLPGAQVDDVVQMLIQLGLSHDEAAVYATLSFLGPSRAGMVASASNLSRAQAYRALELLTGRGIVRTDLSRPRQYTAGPIESLLLHLRGELDSRVQEFRLLEPDLRKAMALPPRDTRTSTSRTDLLRGRKVATTRAEEIYRAARKQVDVIFTHPGGLPLVEAMGHWQLIQDRARSGVRVRLLVAPHPEHPKFYRDAALPNLQIRERQDRDVLAAMVADWQVSLVALVADPASYPRSDRTVALTSDAPNLVQLLTASFEALWTTARPVQTAEAIGSDPPEVE